MQGGAGAGGEVFHHGEAEAGEEGGGAVLLPAKHSLPEDGGRALQVGHPSMEGEQLSCAFSEWWPRRCVTTSGTFPDPRREDVWISCQQASKSSPIKQILTQSAVKTGPANMVDLCSLLATAGLCMHLELGCG